MYLKKLLLRSFRNYLNQEVVFSAPKTILVGDNAQGKSNLLEAVAFLSTLKSHRALRDRDLIIEGGTTGQISGSLERLNGAVELAITLRSTGHRTCTINGSKVRRQREMLGVLNIVQFSSLDLELVRGGPAQRRQWLDGLLVQLEPVYDNILQQYHQVLRQRNALLKDLRSRHGFNSQHQSELALWDTQLATLGARVTRRRARALHRLVAFAQRWHGRISGDREVLAVKYAPNIGFIDEWIYQDNVAPVQQLFLEQMQAKAIAEQHQGTTLVGPHRDDIEFTINQMPVRQFGSSGQQRSLVLALKLAELELIEAVVGEPPLLLLDDVLAELDLKRQNQLLDAIQERFQTLIATTHLESFDAQWLHSSQILSVQAGQVFS